METETQPNGNLFCSFWLFSNLSATYTTVSTGLENWKREISVSYGRNFGQFLPTVIFFFPKRFVAVCGQLKGRQKKQNFESPTDHPFIRTK